MALHPLSPLGALLGAVLGLIVGSFLATVARRAGEGRSAMRGRSACDRCDATLRAAELVPVVSWALQRGRCRRCGVRIDPIHPAVELAAALAGALALGVSPDAVGISGAVFGWGLILLAALDLRHFWLPNRGTLPLAVLGLGASAAGGVGLTDRLIGLAVGYAGLEAVRLLYARVRGRAGLGGGDPKLFGAIGAWLGWAALPGVLLGAGLLGLGVALVLRVRGHAVGATTRLPFGALLAPAGFAAWLFAAAATRL
ncbi:prepilin peptidase [Sphingomonas jatrophae]|uniref:Prepilin leader peptidase/N-methyltransferase n=1 Tax=Sphingomonas jatrophae TaxID=1166337 RepID=A0A1I6JDY8_9SPHN|nr:A24 family peptidase [Sphingomonas jatrophae]SFR76800.1 leader peptidase (prepilin peptidase) / N-methyltransferase [Sphingomonas jatrophae]